MKIMYLITELAPAGAEHVLADLVEGMTECGHIIEVVSLLAQPCKVSVTDRIIAAGASVHYLNARKAAVLSVLKKIRGLIREFRPDLVHAHLMHPNLLSRIALTGICIPLVNTIHIAERRPGKWFYFFADHMTAYRCNRLTAVSHAAAKYHAHKSRIPERYIQVIPNGIDPVTPASADVRALTLADCGLQNCTKIIGCTGRLDWQKGFDRLLHALPELSSYVPHGETWGIIIFGEGQERLRLEKIAKKHSVENIKISLPGYRANAAALMAIFDVFVMPSRYEGYGLALAEAMSLGLPCVTSDADSLPELLNSYPGFSSKLQFTDTRSDDKQLASALNLALHASHCAPYIYYGKQQMIADYLKLYQTLTERSQ